MSKGNAMEILCEQSTQKLTVKRAKHRVNMEKITSNFENKPVHDRMTMYDSSKLWVFSKILQISNVSG